MRARNLPRRQTYDDVGNAKRALVKIPIVFAIDDARRLHGLIMRFPSGSFADSSFLSIVCVCLILFTEIGSVFFKTPGR